MRDTWTGVRSALLLLVCFVGLSQVRGQSPVLGGIIADVNPDSLQTSLRVLTGETGSTRGGQSDTILSRSYRMPGHALAIAFLEQRLSRLGLAVTRNSFEDTILSISGTNILAEEPGRLFPLQKYILCAHFDASGEDTQDSIAPGADDNATGTAAVLEAARLLSRYQSDYTVLYALWDCEEAGILGSDAYAKAARARGDSILGVINLDMLGCHKENDSLMLVAGGTLVPRARELGDTVAQLSQLYKIDLEPVRVFPGIESSDHISFARQKYPAIVLSEYPIDFTSFNGKSSDRIATLNLPYYYRQVNLAVATLAFLAGMNAPLGVGVAKDLPAKYHIEQNYPNPFNPTTTINYDLPKESHVVLKVYNILGQEVNTLVDSEQMPGRYRVMLDGTGLASGVYFYRMQAGSYVETKKLLLVR